MPHPLIAVLTDFGSGSGYVAQMKGVMLGICRPAKIVDISHDIPPHDIQAAAWLLRDVVEAFPADTIFVAVVDPGVGSQRRLVGAHADRGTFLAPDNGLLTLILRDFPTDACVELSRQAFWRETVSPTFHGRDILSSIAGHLALGKVLSDVGYPCRDLVTLPIMHCQVSEQSIRGQIVQIDSFGNLVTNIHERDLQPFANQSIVWQCGGQKISGLSRTYTDRHPGELVALIGSAARLELSRVQGNAENFMHVRVGDEVLGFVA